jgi:hypothetical protein
LEVNVSREKEKGTTLETMLVDWLNEQFDTDEFHRLPLKGAKDEGDVGWLMAHGRKVVLEAKNHKRITPSEFIEEAERERGNADALAKAVVIKRRGVGRKRFGETYVLMELRDLYAIITGEEY